MFTFHCCAVQDSAKAVHEAHANSSEVATAMLFTKHLLDQWRHMRFVMCNDL